MCETRRKYVTYIANKDNIYNINSSRNQQKNILNHKMNKKYKQAIHRNTNSQYPLNPPCIQKKDRSK